MGHLSCNEYYDNIRLNRILRHERNRIARHHNVTPEQLLRRAAYYQPWHDRYATLLRFAAAQKTERHRAILRAASRSQLARHVRDVNDRQVERPVQNLNDRQLERPVRYEHVWQLGALERAIGILPASVEPSTQSLHKVDDTETKKVENTEKEQTTADAEPSSQPLNNVDDTEAKKVEGPVKELATVQALASGEVQVPATDDAHVDANLSTQSLNSMNKTKAEKENCIFDLLTSSIGLYEDTLSTS